jgi:carbonic anhydrase
VPRFIVVIYERGGKHANADYCEEFLRVVVVGRISGSAVCARSAGDFCQRSDATPACRKRKIRQNQEQHPDESMARRKELIAGQHPFAVILGCADSRVPPELLFDQGMGDLFVIRVAGNIVDDAILGSIEYAVEHLGTKLIVVLGHEKCGAVSAAVQGGDAPGHLKTLIDSIRPSVQETAGSPGDRIHNCVIVNARRVARQIRESETRFERQPEQGFAGSLRRLVLDTGAVQLLKGPH